MEISARVENGFRQRRVTLTTAGKSHGFDVGSAANGGELLCLALAICYCNDLYREAAKRDIEIAAVEVEASAEFGTEGAAARLLSYRVAVRARAPEAAIHDLIVQTDRVAEVQNTLRQGMPVALESISAVSTLEPA